MAESADNEVIADGCRRSSRRLSIKRGHSVDDLSILSQSQLSNNLLSAKTRGDFIVVNSNSKRRRKSKQQLSQTQSQSEKQDQSQSQMDSQSQQCDDIIDDKMPDYCTMLGISAQDENVIMSKESFVSVIDQLESLKVTVNTMQKQLNFVSAFLGIDNNELPFTDDDFPTLQKESNVRFMLSDTKQTSTNTDIVVPSEAARINNKPRQIVSSYANVARNSAALSAPLKNAIVSAVYADFEEKDKRAKNIVISGLPNSQSDKTSVENLCNTEFGFTPQIVKCRRLGRQTSDCRVQPLLVILQSVEEAECLIKEARCLRQSSDPAVSSSVYINPDLTKAEALRAYQRRCRRRELAASRNSGRAVQSAHQDHGISTNISEATKENNDVYPRTISVLNSRVPSVQPLSDVGVNTVLNTAAPIPLEHSTEESSDQSNQTKAGESSVQFETVPSVSPRAVTAETQSERSTPDQQTKAPSGELLPGVVSGTSGRHR